MSNSVGTSQAVFWHAGGAPWCAGPVVCAQTFLSLLIHNLERGRDQRCALDQRLRETHRPVQTLLLIAGPVYTFVQRLVRAVHSTEPLTY